MWSALALFTAASGAVPPFQLSAICFLIASLIGLSVMLRQPSRFRVLRQPIKVWALGLFGLFGYHFLYFTALRNAPAVEAGLIAYLWPLLIVVGSALLPGERLTWKHIVGALMGLAGTALILLRGAEGGLGGGSFIGYGAAILCALTWSGYSLLSRQFGETPTDVITGFCLLSAVLSLLCHLALETTVWPGSANQWLAILGLGLGPGACWAGFLCLGLWRQERRYPGSRCFELHCTAVVDPDPHCFRLWRSKHLHRRGVFADYRWRVSCRL